MTEPLKTVAAAQDSQFASPWTVTDRVLRILWEICWCLLCAWTPKPANPWRLFWLGVFSAKIHGTPFVHQRARIAIPWNLTLHDRACLGDRANAYSLGDIEIGARAVVAQEAYLVPAATISPIPRSRSSSPKSPWARMRLSARAPLSCPV